MKENKPRRQRKKVLPIRDGISIYKEHKIKPFINQSSSSASFKWQKKKTANAKELHHKRTRCKDLLMVTGSLLNLLEQSLINQSYAIFLTDKEGYIIEFRADPKTYQAYQNNSINTGFLNQMNYADDANDLWTNSSQCPVIVEELEHYTLNVNGWTCCGVPLRNAKEKLMGLLEVAVPNDTLPPHTHAILLSICRTVEHELAELKKLNKKYAKTKQLEKWILNNLRQTVIALDKKFNILYLNQFGLELINLPQKNIIGRSLFEILPLKPEIEQWWLESLLSGQLDSIQREISIFLQQKRLDLLVQASGLKNAQGKLIGLLLLIN